MSVQVVQQRRHVARDADDTRFAAFLSYSREQDAELAAALQQGLQGFAKPWYRRRRIRVFRDDATLGANAGLWESIQEALAVSEFFVLLASPGTGSSTWVAREVGYWLERNPVERLLVVLTDGNLAAGDPTGLRSTPGGGPVLPAELARRLRSEPRYVDLRWAREQQPIRLRDPRFREALADLAAPIHGRPKDELIGEDLRQHRRALRLARLAGVALAVLALLASLFAVRADQQADRAAEQADLARDQRDLAVSRQLAAEAESDLVDELPRSALLSMAALDVRDTPAARGALLTSLRRTPALRQVIETTPNPLVTAVAWRPLPVSPPPTPTSGDLLAWAEQDGDVRLWDVARSRRVGSPLAGPGEPIDTLVWSPDGDLLAALDDGGTVRVWDVGRAGRSGPPDRPVTLTGGESLGSLSFSRDAKLLVAAGGGRTAVWDTATWRLTGPRPAADVAAFSPDGRTLALVSGRTLSLRDAGRRTVIRSRPMPADVVEDLEFDPSGKTLAVSTAKGLVLLYDVRTFRALGGPLNAHEGPREGSSGSSENMIAFDVGGRYLVSGGADDGAVIWDVVERELLVRYPLAKHERVYGVAVSPDDRRVAIATSRGDVLIWSFADSDPLASALAGHEDWVHAVAFTPDGRTVVSGDRGGTILRWDAVRRERVGEPMTMPAGSGLGDLAVGADGRTLAAAGETVVLFDLTTGRRTGVLDESAATSAVDFAPDGRTIAGSVGKAVVLWDVATRRVGRRLTGHRADVGAVAFAADGRTVAAAADDGRVLVWDAGTGAEVADLSTGAEFTTDSLALSPDGRTLATGGGVSDSRVRLWDLRRRAVVAVLTGHVDRVIDLAFVGTGGVLVSAGVDGAVFLWDVAGRSRIGPALRGHGETLRTRIPLPAMVMSVAVDGRATTLATAGTDGDVVLWDLRPDRWREVACTLAARNLSLVEWNRFLPGREYRRTCPGLPPGEGAPGGA